MPVVDVVALVVSGYDREGSEIRLTCKQSCTTNLARVKDGEPYLYVPLLNLCLRTIDRTHSGAPGTNQ